MFYKDKIFKDTANYYEIVSKDIKEALTWTDYLSKATE